MENTIKEIYNKIDSWLKTQDSKKIKFLWEQQRLYSDIELEKLRKILYYHFEINKYAEDKLEYVFGDKTVTLEYISGYMLKYLGDDKELAESGKDEDGYADKAQFKDIKTFWEGLDDAKILSIVRGSVEDDYDIDLDGYRCYFLTHSKVFPLIFNYVFYVLKKTESELEDDLYNDNFTFESIIEFYPPIELYLPNTETVEKIYHKKLNEYSKNNIRDFNEIINNVIKNDKFKEETALQQKIEKLRNLIQS